MGELNVSLVAVDRKIWSGTASMVVAKTLEGEIGILPQHEPVLALPADSPVRITTTEGRVITAAVHGGFFSVDSDNVAILAEAAELGGEIDVERAQLALERVVLLIRDLGTGERVVEVLVPADLLPQSGDPLLGLLAGRHGDGGAVSGRGRG